jgi:selenocysteine lyase/cysteine desulfurase
MDPYLTAGLTAFSMEGTNPQAIMDYLRERYNLVVRTIGSEEKGTRGVRVSTHVFIFHEHVDMLLEGLQAIRA